MAQTLLGFDLGGYQLKIAQVKGNQLVRFVVDQMPNNLIKDGRVTSYHAMAEYIKETVKKHKLRGKSCALSMTADTCFVRRVRLPKMTIPQLRVNLPFEFKDYVTGELADYVYDYAVLQMGTTEMDLMAAAAEKTLINEYREMMRRAGLKLVKMVPDVLALQKILMPNGAGPQNVRHDYAVLDLGHTSTRMYFFSEGAYEITRTMDSGGPVMAGAVAEEKGVDIHIAQLYLEHNQDNVCELPIISDMREEMITEVMRVMNFYSYNNPSNNIENIYYIGGGVNPDRLCSGIREATGLEVLPLQTLIPGAQSSSDINLGPQAYGAVIE